ncbi:hypothetical protein [Paraburkholderia terrae]|uniref:hypothetical protein n=1 Tax=Paraburkholderia terrae TaxID=311230 RepID=UPI001EE39531|nr:hypothetical protein [Paraburkholderia terrae]GJH02783.1 hypothetical protein CBA19C8_19520 [Paraburkholderia terrae]
MATNTPQADSLRDAKAKWDDLFPSLPETVPVQGNVQVPKSVLSEWFGITIAGVERVERGTPDPILKAIYWQGVVNAVPQVVSHMNSAAANGANWLQQTSPQLQSFLWAIRSSLTWLIAVPDDFMVGDRAPRVAELAAQADEIIAIASRVSDSERQLNVRLAEAESIRAEMSIYSEKAIGYERAATLANTNATTSAAAAELEKQKVDAHVAELSAAVAKQQDLFKHFEDQRSVVEATLQGASRVALAKSFEDRRASLTTLQYVWAGLFVLGISGLTGAGIYLGAAVLAEGKAAAIPLAAAAASGASAVAEVKMSQSNLVFALLRFLVLAPVVWFTWFAARQYGHCQRLGEDYAFKSSAAHAFVGYRDEMGDDAEMLKLLREYAINNFGANPIRVLTGSEPVSPLNDVFDKALEKISPDKFVDLLKEAILKLKS